MHPNFQGGRGGRGGGGGDHAHGGGIGGGGLRGGFDFNEWADNPENEDVTQFLPRTPQQQVRD